LGTFRKVFLIYGKYQGFGTWLSPGSVVPITSSPPLPTVTTNLDPN
jgi:hypothetical protein